MINVHNALDIVFEFDELVYDTTEGGIPMVMVCVNLVSGVLATRNVRVDVQPKPYDPLVDTADRKPLYTIYYSSNTFITFVPSTMLDGMD